MNIILDFRVTIDHDNDSIDELGNSLAIWLKESWFNGEDVLDVEFVDYKVLL